MEQKDQRIAVFVHQLVPDERRRRAGQRRQGGRFAEARAGLDQGQSVVERLAQQTHQARTLDQARAQPRRRYSRAQNGDRPAHVARLN